MNALKKIMRIYGMTQESMASIMKVNQSTVCRYLTGESSPNINSISNLFKEGYIGKSDLLNLINEYGD